MIEDEDLIIAYRDIVYEPIVLRVLLDTKGEMVIAADLDREKLWSRGMENPLEDAETFKMNAESFVTVLGKKPKSIDELQAQYMGLTKVSDEKVSAFKAFYHELDRSGIDDGNNFLKISI